MNHLSTITPSSVCPDSEVCAGFDSDGKPSSCNSPSTEVSNKLDCDRFAVDPFTLIQDRKQLPPRPVVEIVQNLNGYRTTKPTVEMLPVSETTSSPFPSVSSSPSPSLSPTVSPSLSPSLSPSVSTDPSPLVSNNGSHAPTVKPVFQLELKPLSNRFTVTSVKQTGQLLGTVVTARQPGAEAQTQFSSRSSIRSNTSPAVTVTAQAQAPVAPVFSSPQTLIPTGATRFIAGGLPVAEIPIDIREFSDNPMDEDGKTDKVPDPIQGAFQLDPDFFEHHATLRGLNQLDTLDQELSKLWVKEQHPTLAETNPRWSQSSSALEDSDPLNPIPSEPNFSESESKSDIKSDIKSENESAFDSVLDSNQPDELAGVIYARDKQIVFVDGNEGYQYIDLTCFDIKQASFQGNRIQIRNGHQEFEIEYRNLTHVMFADGQEVELANYEEDLIGL